VSVWVQEFTIRPTLQYNCQQDMQCDSQYECSCSIATLLLLVGVVIMCIYKPRLSAIPQQYRQLSETAADNSPAVHVDSS